MRFKVVCTIKDQKFEGYGSSKKLAKLAAARSALAVLEDARAEPAPASAAPAGFLHQTLADHIGKLVNEKFNELMKNDVVHSKRKVLAGVVITTEGRVEGARVVAVTTGTKCVSGEHMSVSGRALNDCHAEVAARRCLQRHLYAQLLMYANSKDPSVPIPESDVEPLAGGGFQLKSSRQVHLYVSTAPCGDGRIFSPHEHHHTEPDKHPNRLARGQLRTKIESGEGTIPVKNCNNVLQTWDGVMQGERLLTMSCSDKVARWCVAGLQGALLSCLLRPVYLQSLVLGSLLHPHHMYRAICGRIEAYISSLPPPFLLHRPLLSRAASAEARTPARAPSFSVCWCSTMESPEIINATTGKLESGQPSLLCKQSMFARWQYLVRRLPLLPQAPELEALGAAPAPPALPAALDQLLYNEAKLMCPTYQLAKQRLIDAFEKAKLGSWIKRPLEQDQFVCEISDAEPALLFAWVGPQPPAARRARPPGGLARDIRALADGLRDVRLGHSQTTLWKDFHTTRQARREGPPAVGDPGCRDTVRPSADTNERTSISHVGVKVGEAQARDVTALGNKYYRTISLRTVSLRPVGKDIKIGDREVGERGEEKERADVSRNTHVMKLNAYYKSRYREIDKNTQHFDNISESFLNATNSDSTVSGSGSPASCGPSAAAGGLQAALLRRRLAIYENICNTRSQ